VVGESLQVRLAVLLLEPETADRVLDVQLVLELVGDLLGAGDDQQVVRHLLGVCGLVSHGPVALQPLPRRVAGQEGAGAVLVEAGDVVAVLPVIVGLDPGGLGTAVVEQLLEGALDGLVVVVVEDDAPAGGAEVPGIDASGDAVVRLAGPIPDFQGPEVVRADRLAEGD
jgi:hypothetical protein